MGNLDQSISNATNLDESFSNFSLFRPFQKGLAPKPKGTLAQQAHMNAIDEANRIAETKSLEQRLSDSEKALAVALAIEKTKQSLSNQENTTPSIMPTTSDASRISDEEVKGTNWLLIGGISTGVVLLAIGAYLFMRNK